MGGYCNQRGLCCNYNNHNPVGGGPTILLRTVNLRNATYYSLPYGEQQRPVPIKQFSF